MNDSVFIPGSHAKSDQTKEREDAEGEVKNIITFKIFKGISETYLIIVTDATDGVSVNFLWPV